MKSPILLIGHQAIHYAEAYGSHLNKYADPTEGARSHLTTLEAGEIASEDPSLIWIPVEPDHARVIKSLVQQDTSGSVDDSYARTRDPVNTIQRWRRSAQEAGDTALVAFIDALGEKMVASIYSTIRTSHGHA